MEAGFSPPKLRRKPVSLVYVVMKHEIARMHVRMYVWASFMKSFSDVLLHLSLQQTRLTKTAGHKSTGAAGAEVMCK